LEITVFDNIEAPPNGGALILFEHIQLQL
jgi:hypothetical protein